MVFFFDTDEMVFAFVNSLFFGEKGYDLWYADFSMHMFEELVVVRCCPDVGDWFFVFVGYKKEFGVEYESYLFDAKAGFNFFGLYGCVSPVFLECFEEEGDPFVELLLCMISWEFVDFYIVLCYFLCDIVW